MQADAQTLPNPSPRVSAPIFLVGCERSGTTLTMVILNHHPRIAFFNLLYAVEMLGEGDRWPDRAAYLSYLATNRMFQDAGLTIDESLDYPALVDSFLDQKRRQAGKPLIGAKIPDHFDRVLSIWPDARFIHLLRDGRDVAMSLIDMGWAGNMVTAGERWLDAEEKWDRLESTIAPERWTELRFEQLVTDPEPTLRKLCEFIGVPYDSAMLEYPKDTTYGPPSGKMVGNWRRKLRQRQVRQVEGRIGQMLARRGYELSGLPAVQPGPVTARLLRLQDRWYRAMFKRRRYGMFLYVADYLSRRLGIPGFQSSVKQRLNQIDVLYLK